ncbi:MAG: peptide chain release factor N(5)-glutamine methyltransferase [Erysipelotrichaceae bacterium]|jgi:release factor glutamine methyltransferase|nr:peptide chain release factor N(5)-glutamine methyltransferase [Erysipelotrichaceae bacterium]
MTSYREALKQANHLLKNPIDRQEAHYLLVELAKQDFVDLYLSMDEEASEDFLLRFKQGVHRLIKQEPLAHILGYTYFYGYRIKCDPRALIPRRETEELAGEVLATIDTFFKPSDDLVLADIGTGSGALAITFGKELAGLEVIATDISKDALALARENSEANHVKLRTFCGSLLEPLIKNRIKLDILVCNPPYIPTKEEVAASVKNYEPHIALYGGEDGMQYYHELFDKANQVLKDRAFMAFEIGEGQKLPLLQEIAAKLPDMRALIKKDMQGVDRMLFVFKGNMEPGADYQIIPENP